MESIVEYALTDAMSFYTPRDLAAKLNVSKETLRRWSEQGRLRTSTTQGGHRRYIYSDQDSIHPDILAEDNKRSVVYARVSSKKQKQDLNRQIMFLRERFPNHEVVSDIGSGINYKRKGLLYILELLYKGGIREVVVAHRDRLCRFGFDLFDFMFKQHGALLTVLENPSDSVDDRASELSEDLMAITTVFTARYYGSRKYTRKAVDV
jgi:putative resolvase